MKIDKENIEEYIFNYLEGNLSENEMQEFKSYLKTNPNTKSELADWKQSYIISGASIYTSDFSALKKSNKVYYWVTGIVATFLLGLGIMLYYGENQTREKLPKSNIEVVIPSPIQKSGSVKTETDNIEHEKIDNKRPPFEKKSINKDVKLSDDGFSKESDIELTKQLEIEITPAISKRTGKLDPIKEEKKDKAKKKDEVDVIDIETGF